MVKTKKNIKNKTKKNKTLNCNPAVSNKRITKYSCLTSESLKHIKESWNAEHTDKKINAKSSREILKELKSKLLCKDEKCWIETIKDAKLRKKLYDYSFAPKHPEEWHYNPNTWLTNYDILEVLKQYEEAYKNFKFIGPTPIDFDSRPFMNDSCVWRELCSFDLSKLDNGINKIGIIFNLDKHNEPGSHWTSLFIDLEEGIIFYFDSAGSDAPNEVKSLVSRIVNQGLIGSQPIRFVYHENSPVVHQYENSECGMYSLYFIITMLSGVVGKQKIKNMQKRIEYFKTPRIKDDYVFKYRKIYFNEQ